MNSQLAQQPETAVVRKPLWKNWGVVTLVVLPLLGTTVLVYLAQPGLTTTEKRLLGTWTWKRKPGDSVLYVRDDHTMRTVFSGTPKVSFVRWCIEGDILKISYARSLPSRLWEDFVARTPPEECDIRFNENGEVELSTGTLIPWDGELAQQAREAE